MPFDAFLKIETPNITGESTDSKHKGEIEIYSFSLGASNPTTIGSATGGAEEDGQDQPGLLSGLRQRSPLLQGDSDPPEGR